MEYKRVLALDGIDEAGDPIRERVASVVMRTSDVGIVVPLFVPENSTMEIKTQRR